MRVIDLDVPQTGLIRKLVKNGYADTKIIVQNVEILSIKSILCLGNPVFKQLMEDTQFSGRLVLCDGSSEVGFYALERYYTGESIEINSINVIDIIAICLFYNEEKLLKIAKKYLKSHLNEITVLNLIKLMNRMSENKMIEFHEITSDYLYKNGYRYLNNNTILNFKINELYYILTSPKLIIESENELLNRLLLYKDTNLTIEEDKEDFSKLLKLINWKLVEIDKIPIEKREYLKLHSFSLFDQSNNLPVRVYLKLPDEIPACCKEIIIKYYTEDSKMIEIEKQDKMMLLENKIENFINLLLDIEDKKLTIVTMTIIVDLNIKFESSKRSFIMSQFLLWHSQSNDISVKETIPKCLSYFITSKSSAKAFQQLFGISMIFDMLNHIDICSVSFRGLMKYIKKIGLTDEQLNNLNPEILDIYNSKLDLSLQYSDSIILRNEEVNISPYEKPVMGRYSITPELFEGLHLDEETGTIYGKCEEDKESTTFEIVCETPHKKLLAIVVFSVCSYGFLYNSKDNILSNTFSKDNKDEMNCCFLNMEIQDGEIWHMIYKFIEDSDIEENDDDLNNCEIGFGGTTNNHYEGKNLTREKYSFGVYFSVFSHLNYISNYNSKQKESIKCEGNIDGDKYECVYNMVEKTFTVIQNFKDDIFTIYNIPSKFYPYVENFYTNTIQILSIWKE